jgi:homogentisate 1,2-dioxygenase
MPFYHTLGQIPHKRHTQFKKPDGKLYREELMGLEGFSSIQSILYHHFLPPRVTKTEDMGSLKPDYVDFGPIQHRAFRTIQAQLGADPISARIALLGNNDVILGIARASGSMDYFYRNAQAYETW